MKTTTKKVAQVSSIALAQKTRASMDERRSPLSDEQIREEQIERRLFRRPVPNGVSATDSATPGICAIYGVQFWLTPKREGCFFGFKSDVEAAEALYASCRATILEELKERTRGEGVSAWKFKVGVAERLNNQLTAAAKKFAGGQRTNGRGSLLAFKTRLIEEAYSALPVNQQKPAKEPALVGRQAAKAARAKASGSTKTAKAKGKGKGKAAKPQPDLRSQLRKSAALVPAVPVIPAPVTEQPPVAK